MIIALLSELNSLNVAPISCIDSIDGASLAFIDTVCASPTFSSDGTAMLDTTVRTNQPRTMNGANARMTWAIFERAGPVSLIRGHRPPMDVDCTGVIGTIDATRERNAALNICRPSNCSCQFRSTVRQAPSRQCLRAYRGRCERTHR